ncbi:MAG: hypothetical protein K2J47_10585 [Ruminococcus sp.]|nr:hypothetical protein [Ruminococcus sp.]
MNDYRKVTDRIEPSERCREEIFNMSKRRKNHIRLNKKGVAAIVAVAVAACGGTAVFAADKLGAFDKLRNIKERTVTTDDGREFPINKFEHKDYDKIADNAEILSEPVTENTENISISIDSVYCDGRTIILGITGSLTDGNPENYGFINLAPELEINGRIYNYSHSCLSNANGYMVLDEGAQNSFTGSITLILVEDEKLTEPTEIKVHMNDICCAENYFSDRVSIGGMTLTTTITPETSLMNNCNIVKSEDGFTATIYDISPTMMTVNYNYPIEYDLNEEKIEIEESGRIIEIPKYALFAMWYDADGNRLKHLEMTVDMGNNIYAECIEPPSTDTVIVKFCNLQQDDENGMPVVIKEMTVDLSEIKSAE